MSKTKKIYTTTCQGGYSFFPMRQTQGLAQDPNTNRTVVQRIGKTISSTIRYMEEFDPAKEAEYLSKKFGVSMTAEMIIEALEKNIDREPNLMYWADRPQTVTEKLNEAKLTEALEGKSKAEEEVARLKAELAKKK